MKIDWKLVGKTISGFLERKSPEILTGMGIAGMGVSIIFAVKATSKVSKITVPKENEVVPYQELTAKEKLHYSWKYYVPCAISFATSAGCIIFATSELHRRNAALAAVCSVTETALQDYKTAAKELLGEKKEVTLQEKANEKAIEKHDIQEGKTYILKGTQEVCYDPWSGRDFPYDIDDLKHAIEDLSYQLRDEEFISLNEFYDMINLDRTKTGEVLGWNAIDGPVRPCFSSTIVKDRPCLVLGFSRDPGLVRKY